MAEARATNPFIEQFRKGGVPKELRLMAAQGALPLKPEDLVELWTDLTRDPDPEVKDTAEASLLGFAAADFQPILKSRETPASVLNWAVRHRPERELREVALQNTSLPDETIEDLAGELSQELAELVVINQQRLLRRTSLLDTLQANPHLSNDQRRRLNELRETFKIGDQYQEKPAPPPPPPERPKEREEPVEEIALVPQDLSDEEVAARMLTADEIKDTAKLSAVQKLYRLNTAEKLQTALKGTREERAILIRDPNKLVSSAVLGSGLVTDPEIESFSAMKNVAQDVLRKIGTHKEWTKKYQVISNLVRNPRTPVGIAMTMIPRLNPRDMKTVAVDKNVPEAIRKAAQKFIKGPEEKRAGGKH